MKQTLNYVISKDDCILSPEDCGLVNGLITVNGWTDDLAAIRGLYAPPYFSDNFRLQIRFNGRSVPAYGYTWAPEKLTRHGDKREPLDDGGATSWSYHSELFLAANRRAAILKVRGGNMLQKLGIPMKVQLEVTGGVRKLPHWEFSRPSGAGIADKRWRDSVFSLVTDDGAISVGCSLPMTPLGPLCSGVLEEEAPIMRRQLEFFVAVAVGANQDESDAIAREILMNPEDTIDASQRLWEERVKRLRKAMPEFRCDDREWERLYDQSLLHLLLNEWDVPEFKLHPSYSTGSVNGGCVCNYLWNYGRPFRLWSMLNPQSAKAHIRAFLSLDLTSCYAFHLDDATPFGPYYPVNQEKIVFLIHAYVLQTGDVAFLQETLGGKSILEHAMEQALMHDDLSKDAVLVDYGDGNHHLELRRTLRYDGIVPDLNLRRCITYHLVDELCKLAGVTPKVDFAKRAEALKALVKARLFDAEHGWFKAIDPDGKPYFRYTMQLFKALGWNDWAVDKEEEEALLRHLMNPEEFRGEFGLHSLSKQDPAYDENDVDHGGPGACIGLTAAVIERLYMCGRGAEASSLLKSLLWLGRHLPYLGDSHRADIMDYRHDTPLQNDIQAAAIAQAMIFGLFGITVLPDHSVRICPHLPDDMDWMTLKHARLAGLDFSVSCEAGKGTVVTWPHHRLNAPMGTPVIIHV